MSFLRRVFVLALLGYWSVLFLSTHVPLRTLRSLPSNDKFLHWCAYAGLGFLLASVWAARRPTPAKLFRVVLVVGLYGAADEWLQLLVPGRSCEWWDWCADLAGALCGLTLYLAAWALWNRLPSATGWSSAEAGSGST